MIIDSEVIPASRKEGRKAGRYLPKWIFYSLGGIGVLILVGLIKALLPAIGLAFLLAYIWSQEKSTLR